MTAPTTARDRRREALRPSMWTVIPVLALTILYGGLQVAAVRPFLWPAGTGAAVAGDPASALPILARPPGTTGAGAPRVIDRVSPGTPAALAGIRPGDVLLDERVPGGPPAPADPIDAWRARYWMGLGGPVEWRVAPPGGAARTVVLARPAAIRTPAADAWSRRHTGLLLQMACFIGAAVVLVLLRSSDLTAALAVLALALSAAGSGGPLLGAERILPAGARELLTLYAWMASPLAFPVITLAIAYFPSRSPLVGRHPSLLAVPWLAAAPMLVLGAGTALFLAGADWARGAARWDASHPGLFLASFAASLAVNLAAMAGSVYRYRLNHDANERRRIRAAIYTTVPGVAAYALKDGLANMAVLAGWSAPAYPAWVEAVLQGLVLLPAFGLVYAVGVERVLGPRVVLRRSLQYALARRTLTLVALLPAAALAVSLTRNRSRTIGELATSRAGLYLALIGASAAALRYRDRAQQWLDERFFREEYDARQILLSLAGRVRLETDPADLTALVVGRIDEALHPETVAVLVSGIEDGCLTPVSVLRGSVEPLPLDGGLVAMLRWSDDPLEIFPQDPRSPVHRLPAAEQEWLACTRAALLVPVVGEDRALLAVIALGGKLSEEAYTAEDRQLLASIASQMGLGFDVARLRRGTAAGFDPEEPTKTLATAVRLAECPRCGRCADAGTPQCPADGAPLTASLLPRVIDGKYRIEQLLGRGGMGAVYRARDLRLDRAVAVKVILAELVGDPGTRRRFRQEAQIVARLQHPSIVSVFDYGTLDDGGVYLVMELVRGLGLRRVLQRDRRLAPERALPILRAVCAGIDAAHRDGVLHRDLKPENILVPEGDPAAMVLDFGIARVTGGAAQDTAAGLTAPGLLVGTPAYMAPEQFQGVAPDARTDVFALGVIAYEMVSGELPFGRGPLADLVMAQARGARPLPPDIVPAPMDLAIRAALEGAAERRPPGALAFAALLDAALER